MSTASRDEGGGREGASAVEVVNQGSGVRRYEDFTWGGQLWCALSLPSQTAEVLADEVVSLNEVDGPGVLLLIPKP